VAIVLQGHPGRVAVNRQAILDLLHAEAPGLRKKYGIKSLAVFGSMARGDDREGSDVDILVTFEGPATFRGFMGLKLDLEEMFSRPVDLGTPDALRPEMRADVEKDLLMSRDWRLYLGDMALFFTTRSYSSDPFSVRSSDPFSVRRGPIVLTPFPFLDPFSVPFPFFVPYSSDPFSVPVPDPFPCVLQIVLTLSRL
jgi:uncharacterized protein